MSPSTGALSGLRVVDLTRYIPGPYCTMLLGDLGADVVKIEEPPLGDPTRAVPPLAGEGSAVHAALNRNKRSLSIDLRQAEGVAVVRRLAETADVFVEGLRPGVLARRGLGAEELLAANPRLVYCSLSGYGQQGPLASRAGHDINYLAQCGFLGSNLDGEGRPVLPWTQVADMAGGLAAVMGILAALLARERTGRGQQVDASLFDAALALMTVPLARVGAGLAGVGELSGSYAGYNVYRCRDGRYVSVGALEPKFWEALCRALGLPDKIKRQWEGSPGARRATIDAVAGAFAARDRDQWVKQLAEQEVCVEPVLDAAEALAHADAAGRLLDQPNGDTPLRTVAPPLRLSETPIALRQPAPELGEHTDAVLSQAGYEAREIEALRGAGVVS
ncbi:MAG TPA: CaiB/BaiF CoA-transferase family protein [Vicinamibacteria bacterium]|nr:CaiB/BaiF CoA-transferase family protein [Vicinamibacteria bacterium]